MGQGDGGISYTCLYLRKKEQSDVTHFFTLGVRIRLMNAVTSLSTARSAALAARSRPALFRHLRDSTSAPKQRVTRGCYATMTERSSVSAYLPSDTYNSLPKARRVGGRSPLSRAILASSCCRKCLSINKLSNERKKLPNPKALRVGW